MKTKDQGGMNRRSILVQGATLGAAVVAGVSALPETSLAQAKVSQKSVAYQNEPKGPQRCDNCRLFEPPAACKNVQSPISPQGWCRIWAAKA